MVAVRCSVSTTSPVVPTAEAAATVRVRVRVRVPVADFGTAAVWSEVWSEKMASSLG